MMTTTATKADKKRSKAAKEAEESAQALKQFEETATAEAETEAAEVETTSDEIDVDEPIPYTIPRSEIEDKYRATLLSSIPFTKKAFEKLEIAEVVTVGDLEDAFEDEGDAIKVLISGAFGMTEAEAKHVNALLCIVRDKMEADAALIDVPGLEKQLEDESEADEEAAEEHRKAQAFETIAALNSEASKAFDAWKRADEISKGKKKGYEAAVNELRGYIDKMAHPEAMPLFDKKAEPDSDTEDSSATEVNPPDESWRDTPLREALPELTETVHLKLEGAQLFTMGELANWTAENGGRRRLSDIAGIGAGTAGKIEEATMAFWQRWKPSVNGEAKPEASDDKKVATAFIARRQFLDTKFADLDIGDGPRMLLDAAGMTKVGHLEMSSSVLAVGIFDRLKDLGMDDAEAKAVIETLNAENTRLAAGETS